MYFIKNDAGEEKVYRKGTFFGSVCRILIFVGTPLVVLAAARNTITWHCQRFWGASANFWQSQWDQILGIVGEDPVTLWVYGSILVPFMVYWIVGTLYTLLDLTNRPESLMRYKIQPGTNEPVDKKKLVKVIINVMTNQILVTFLFSWLNLYVVEWRGFPDIKELPTFHWVLFELAVLIMVEEIGFYYTHRILHNKLLYKYVHKKHHEWTAPIAIAAIYCHPVEFVFSNLLPIWLGIFITGSHIATTYLWYCLAILSTLHSHCGYHLPFIPSAEFHDYHHLKFSQCFGVLGIMDRLHGTDSKFRESVQGKRHVVMMNLVPPRELYPDPAPKYQMGK